jgi:hypothetical protein
MSKRGEVIGHFCAYDRHSFIRDDMEHAYDDRRAF